MSEAKKRLRLVLLILGVTIFAGGDARQALTQETSAANQEEEETRQIKLSGFTSGRPAAVKPSGSGSNPSKTGGGDSASWNAPTYRRVKPVAPVRRKPARTTPVATTGPKRTRKPNTNAKPARVEPVETKEVGITLWRLRPAREDDTGPGFQVLQGGKLVVMTPERVAGTAPVALGDRVRISVESPRDGYLYVINREQYADGTTGAPMLIFPTTRIRGGDNKVTAGRLVDIPDAGDAQPFFTLTSNRPAGQPQAVGELITVLITPRPLEGITPGRSPVQLKPEQVARWEGEWEAEPTEVLEMNGGEGRAWTQAEKLASEATRSLTQIDPTPQTVYRVTGKPGEPLMVTVQMLYAKPASAPQAGVTNRR